MHLQLQQDLEGALELHLAAETKEESAKSSRISVLHEREGKEFNLSKKKMLFSPTGKQLKEIKVAQQRKENNSEPAVENMHLQFDLALVLTNWYLTQEER